LTDRPRGGGDLGVDQTRARVTRLLEELQDGKTAVLDELFALLYEELRAIAHRQRRRWQGDDTLDTTALVHEAYLKLVGQARLGVESRAHFFALAAKAMRHLLCSYLRDRSARKRGGGLERLPLDEWKSASPQLMSSEESSEILLALDEALRRLERIDPRQSKVVECRFFGGLTIEETATAIGISPRTVRRDWAVAQAWLHREMKSHV
jgi:RNA polymerase sigma factor (TIGR02999 family)